MNLLIAAALLLQPVLAEDGDLRLVAVGTGGDEVTWTLDGRTVATTRDGEAAAIPASAGPHDLWATSEAQGPWRVLARPDGAVAGGAGPVPAWTAVNVEPGESGPPAWLWPVATLAAALLALVRPSQGEKTYAAVRSVLQAWTRRRRS